MHQFVILCRDVGMNIVMLTKYWFFGQPYQIPEFTRNIRQVSVIGRYMKSLSVQFHISDITSLNIHNFLTKYSQEFHPCVLWQSKDQKIQEVPLIAKEKQT